MVIPPSVPEMVNSITYLCLLVSSSMSLSFSYSIAQSSGSVIDLLPTAKCKDINGFSTSSECQYASSLEFNTSSISVIPVSSSSCLLVSIAFFKTFSNISSRNESSFRRSPPSPCQGARLTLFQPGGGGGIHTLQVFPSPSPVKSTDRLQTF